MGGLRPIAVGMTLRRLVAKVANTHAVRQCASFLSPRQLGVGVRGGCEAAVHAARSYLEGCSPGEGVLKVDFKNAFNCVRRGVVLEAVATHLPDLLPFVSSSYASPSRLLFGEFVVVSGEGVQQGDPLGPLLFCLAIADILGGITADLVMGYLDDITIGGSIKDLVSLVPKFEASSLLLGLSLNRSKCEFVGKGVEFGAAVASSGLGVPLKDWGDAGLLGSPLYVEGVSGVLIERCADMCRMTGRLQFLSRHESLFLLRSSLRVPRLLHVLRSSPCFRSPEITVFDEALRSSLSKISNCCLSDNAWARASLPVWWGGFGSEVCVLFSGASVFSILNSLLSAGQSFDAS